MNQLVTANEQIEFGEPRVAILTGKQELPLYLEVMCNKDEREEILEILETSTNPQTELRRYLADMLEHGAEVDVC